MRRRLGLLASLCLLVPLLAGLPHQAATADPIPIGTDLPWCMSTGRPTIDDDNMYCVISIEKDTTGTGTDYQPLPDIPYGIPGRAGQYEDVWVYSWNARHAIAWAMNTRTIDNTGAESAPPVNATNPAWAWRIRVNTGAMYPRQLNGVTKDNDYTVTTVASGYRLTTTFKPAPIAWRWNFSGGANPPCEPGNCGDSTTVAELTSNGFFNGYVTDLSETGLPSTEIAHRTGMITAWNAQYATEPAYNPALNALEIQMANAHLKAPGVPATGHYEAFLPNAYLIHELQVPDPSSLAGGSFIVSNAATSATYPYLVTHEPGGVRIRIPTIGFSSPKLRIKPRPSIPGKPRWGSVTRVTATKVKLRFYRPYADGGPNISAYQGRCRRGTGVWHYNKASGSPIYIGSLSRLKVDCQVRAQNIKGYGRWNAVKRG